MTDVIMPRLSDSMEEGTILKWLKSSGEEVKLGEPIAEIETDKATMTYEADAAGFFQPLASEGDTLAIGAVIARLLASADEASARRRPPRSAPAGRRARARRQLPQPESEPEPEPDAGRRRRRGGDGAEPVAAPVAAPGAPAGAPRPVDASRHRRWLAASQPSWASSSRRSPAAAPKAGSSRPTWSAAAERGTPAPPAHADGDVGVKGAVTTIEPTRTQQLIARRMASAKATIPEFQVTVEVDAEAALALREQLRGQTEPLPSVNDLVIKACALALRAHPRVNASYVDGRFEQYGRVNVGMAVAGDGTLVVPTVFDADIRSLTEIAVTTRELAGKVRDGTLTPPDLAGGTFTVSNLGMFGVARFTAVINPPQAAILAVGTATPRAIVGPDGAVSMRRVIELTISADHRIVYGADAADFLGTVRKRLERPAGLLL